MNRRAIAVVATVALAGAIPGLSGTAGACAPPAAASVTAAGFTVDAVRQC